ncbi:hypothetical protein QQF64_026153 [Cirrhinus molitorella]|uniref:Integrase catalytic domain-containing protein n=1 Tax=Cirrhinus molitorella TaxID=172907 RepID=A0ABR3NR19_9TELE
MVKPEVEGLVLEMELDTEHREKKNAVELFYLGQVEKLPVSATDIRPTNGQAERFVQSLKQALKVSKGSSTLQKRLETFLLTYRNTPHPTTKESPSLLFLGRQLRTRLDALKPSVTAAVRLSQTSQVLRRAGHLKPRQFEVGDAVLARDYRGRERWASGVVTTQSGPVSYTVDVGASEEWRRHTDQLLSIPTKTAESQFTELPKSKNMSVPLQTSVNATSPTPPTKEEEVNSDISAECQKKQDKPNMLPSQVRRYPARVIKPPNRLTL